MMPRSLAQAILKPAALAFEANGVGLQGHAGGARGRAKARNPRHVLGPRPASQFLTATAQQWLEPEHPLGHNERADALGAANLVRGQRQQIGIQAVHAKRPFSERLDRIDMQHDRRRHAPAPPLRPPAAARRFRCWRASPTPAPAARSPASPADEPDRARPHVSRRWCRSHRLQTGHPQAPRHARSPKPANGWPEPRRLAEAPASAPAHSPRFRLT